MRASSPRGKRRFQTTVSKQRAAPKEQQRVNGQLLSISEHFPISLAEERATLRSVYAHVRKKFFDSRVVRVVPVVRLLRNSPGRVQKKTKGIHLILRDSVLSYNTQKTG